MSHFPTNPFKEFMRDVRHYPDSFKDLDYQRLVATIKNIEHQCLLTKFDEGLFLDFSVNPAYMPEMLPLKKRGFKDVGGFKMLPAVRFEIYNFDEHVTRVQLLIHASKDRPVHMAIRVRHSGSKNWVLYECNTSTMSDIRSLAIR